MLALLIALFIAAGDQASKEWTRQSLLLHDPHAIIDGFFNLTYIRNTGAAWGMFGGQNSWLIVFSAIMLTVMIAFRRSFLRDTPTHRWTLGLLAGGILGNLFDRVRLGYVTDFLDFRFGTYAFPAFNVADAAITVGVVLYIGSSVLLEWRESRTGGTADSGAPPETPHESGPATGP